MEDMTQQEIEDRLNERIRFQDELICLDREFFRNDVDFDAVKRYHAKKHSGGTDYSFTKAQQAEYEKRITDEMTDKQKDKIFVEMFPYLADEFESHKMFQNISIFENLLDFEEQFGMKIFKYITYLQMGTMFGRGTLKKEDIEFTENPDGKFIEHSALAGVAKIFALKKIKLAEMIKQAGAFGNHEDE